MNAVISFLRIFMVDIFQGVKIPIMEIHVLDVKFDLFLTHVSFLSR